MYVVPAAGAEAERDLPFGALALAMGTATADLDELPAPQAAALRTALALDTGPPPDRFAVGAATLGVMTRRAERQPLAILLDDAHHLDRPSAEALVFAARRLVADPILVVAALREGEPSPLRAADLPVLAITGLDQAGTADLLRSADTAPGASDRVAWVHRATGGNPLAIVESARTAAESEIGLAGKTRWHPSRCRRRSRRGLCGGRGRSGRRLPAARVGRGGGGGPARGPRRGAGPPPRSRPPAADRAAALVRTTADRVVFTHPLVGSSAYASLTPDRRRAVHAAVVAALPPQDTARRAWHGAAAALGPDTQAAAALEIVAARPGVAALTPSPPRPWSVRPS